MPRPKAPDGQGLSAAERKALQRARSAERRAATAERIHTVLSDVFKAQCRFLSSGLMRREPTLTEIVDLVANQFPADQRDRVLKNFGLKQSDKS